MNKRLIGILKKITAKPKRTMALTLDPENLKRSLDIVLKDEDFKKLKKEFFKVRDAIANKTDLNEDQANSMMNYALHHNKH